MHLHTDIEMDIIVNIIIHVQSFYWYKQTKLKKNNDISCFVSCLRGKKNLLPATASVERLEALVGGAGGEKNFPEAVASPAGSPVAGSSGKNY